MSIKRHCYCYISTIICNFSVNRLLNAITFEEKTTRIARWQLKIFCFVWLDAGNPNIFKSHSLKRKKRGRKMRRLDQTAVKECFGSWGKWSCHLCCELSSSYGQRGEHLGEPKKVREEISSYLRITDCSSLKARLLLSFWHWLHSQFYLSLWFN